MKPTYSEIMAFIQLTTELADHDADVDVYEKLLDNVLKNICEKVLREKYNLVANSNDFIPVKELSRQFFDYVGDFSNKFMKIEDKGKCLSSLKLSFNNVETSLKQLLKIRQSHEFLKLLNGTEESFFLHLDLLSSYICINAVRCYRKRNETEITSLKNQYDDFQKLLESRFLNFLGSNHSIQILQHVQNRTHDKVFINDQPYHAFNVEIFNGNGRLISNVYDSDDSLEKYGVQYKPKITICQNDYKIIDKAQPGHQKCKTKSGNFFLLHEWYLENLGSCFEVSVMLRLREFLATFGFDGYLAHNVMWSSANCEGAELDLVYGPLINNRVIFVFECKMHHNDGDIQKFLRNITSLREELEVEVKPVLVTYTECGKNRIKEEGVKVVSFHRLENELYDMLEPLRRQ